MSGRESAASSNAESNTPAQPASRALPLWQCAVLLAALTAAVYLPILANGFILVDDPGYVTENLRVQSGLSWQNAAWAFRTLEMSNWHPLAWLSHMLDCQLFGVRPFGHHLTSLLLHTLNAVLLFLLMQKATGMRWRSFFVAALFALHPLNVESVAWVAERKSLLSLLFSLCAIAAYGWYARKPGALRYISVAVAFALALLSKPMAVTLPVLLLLLDYWPLERNGAGAGKKSWPALIVEKIPLLAMSAASSWITIVAQARGGAVKSMEKFPLAMRVMNAARSYVLYLRRTIWPSDLSCFYPLRRADMTIAKALPAAAILLLLTLLVLRSRRRPLLVGWFFFLIALLPVIGLLQVGSQAMADRYAYVPLIGLFMAIVWELADAAQRLKIGPGAQAAIAIVLLAMAAASTVSNEMYWKNDITLFTRAHELTNPPSLVVERDLAQALADAGRISEAAPHYRIVAELDPNKFMTHYNYGYALAQSENLQEAVREFQQALNFAESDAERIRGWKSLGYAYLYLGDRQQAADAFQKASALGPPDSQNSAAKVANQPR
jgi:signal transduction histidine kinase